MEVVVIILILSVVSNIAANIAIVNVRRENRFLISHIEDLYDKAAQIQEKHSSEIEILKYEHEKSLQILRAQVGLIDLSSWKSGWHVKEEVEDGL